MEIFIDTLMMGARIGGHSDRKIIRCWKTFPTACLVVIFNLVLFFDQPEVRLGEFSVNLFEITVMIESRLALCFSR